MQIPPRYHITSEMIGLIARIDANREVIASLEPAKIVVEKIHSASLLKSSLFSARIEGNTTTYEELDEKNKGHLEIFNILKAINFIRRQVKPRTRITKKLLTQIHALVLKGITIDAGSFRRETTAIFNSAGIAIYMPPPPSKITEYLNQLLLYIHHKDEQFALVNGFMSHLIFEKIHPFIDGNGRVGRLLIYAILQSKGYDFGIHVPIEEYIDAHKQDYYYFLDTGLQEPNDYLAFMLNAYYQQTEQIKKILQAEKNPINALLPPRQEEMYNLIKDHKVISLDSLKRRFLKIPERTLRYDLQKLTAAGLILKIGKTKGVFYRIS